MSTGGLADPNSEEGVHVGSFPPVYALNEEDKKTELAKKIRQLMERRLNNLRLYNDIQREVDETAHVRGRIAEAKLLITWLKPSKINTEKEIYG